MIWLFLALATLVVAWLMRERLRKYRQGEVSLEAAASKIEDFSRPPTRFLVIGKEKVRPSGKDKTSLMFDLPHQPGALADAMVIFKRNRLNLTCIESFPKRGSTNEYLFFVEMEGHHEDTKVKRALAGLKGKTERLEILGSYARSAPVESP